MEAVVKKETENDTVLLHGTALTLQGCGVLISGRSGAGKSDLALRLLYWDGKVKDAARAATGSGFALVSDDQVEVRRQDRCLIANAPAAIAGKMEVRGVGVIDMPFAPQTELRLCVDLVARKDVPRIPEEPQLTREICGIEVPRLLLAPFDASTPIKLMLALRQQMNDFG